VFHGNQQELDDEMEEHHKDNPELKDNVVDRLAKLTSQKNESNVKQN
jgi:hypothetical protein